MLEVKIERTPQKNERKLLFPTIKLVETALKNSGYVDGIWTMKSPRRIRKRGAERFRAIRVEGSGIKIRCKPGGNETRYEWVLFAPEKHTAEDVFFVLCSLHPSTVMPLSSLLKEDSKIVSNLFEKSLDRKPSFIPVPASSNKELKKPKEPSVSCAEVSKAFEKNIESLDISQIQDHVSCDAAINRALIVFSIFSENNFIKRSNISEKMIKLLKLEDLIKVSPIYSSIPAVMRAIMMGLCKEGFIERVISNKKNGLAGGATAGYRITEKGFCKLKSIQIDPELQKEIQESSKTSKTSIKNKRRTLEELKRLISEHDSLTHQISEFKELIEDLTKETVSQDEIISSLEQKKKEQEALNKEIKDLELKLAEFKKTSSKDIEDLNKEMTSLIEKKKEIESELL